MNKINSQKGFVVPLVIAIIVALAIGGVWYSKKHANAPVVKTQIDNAIVAASSTISSDLKTYTNDKYGYSFVYPVSWKKVTDANDMSGANYPYKYLATLVYPTSYPAQDYSAAVFVENAGLTVVKNKWQPKNQTPSIEIVNNISWTKFQAIDYAGNYTDSYSFLAERNGYTYIINGSAELTSSILSNFKFTN